MQPLSRRTVLGLLAGTATGVPALAQDARVPVQVFANRPTIYMPRLSPDGKHLLVSKRVMINDRDVSLMIILTTDTFRQTAQIRLPAYHVPSQYWWVSNSRIIVAPAKEYGSLEAPIATGELLGFDVDGGNQEYLFGYDMGRFKRTVGDDRGFAEVEAISEERDGRFYVAEHIWGVDTKRTNLYEIHAKGGKRRLVADVEMPRANFVLKRNGDASFAYGSTEDAKTQMMEYDSARSAWKVHSIEGTDRFSPIAYAGEGAVYALVGKGGGPSSLVLQQVATGERKVLASHPIGSTDSIEWGPRGLKPVAVTTNVGVPAPQYPEPETPEAQLHKALSSQFPGSYVRFESFSDDGDQLLFSVRSDRNPGEYYLLDRKANKAQPLFASRPEVNAAQMGERRAISFRDREGRPLHGYLTLPPGAEAKNLPLVLHPHGGPQGPMDTWFFDNDSQFLASRGYAVLQVNFRGSGGRGSPFSNAGYKQWATGMIDDLVDGVRWALAEGIADPKRIAAYGGSYGAYASMMVAIREPGLLKCAVGYAGLYDLASLFRNDASNYSPRARAFYIRAVGNDKADWAAKSPVSLAGKVGVPVLLVHGEEDDRTPYDQAKAFRDALTSAGKDVEWMGVPNEWHGFYAVKNRVAFLEKLEAFLGKHLKA